MALGGYKFRGYKFVLPSDYDATVDEQVIAQALRLHKCKLKAFMSACAATNADWQFYETNGDASFETYGNVIYKLDADGFNYASFFRYGSDDAYYCMLTISNGSTNGTVGILLQNYYSYYSSTTFYHTSINNDMDSIGIAPITFANVFDSNAMFQRLSFYSQDNSGTYSGTNSATLSKSLINHYCGYAIKGKNIISIFGNTLNILTPRVLSVGSLRLSSPDDTSNMFSNTFTFFTITGSSVLQYVYNITEIQVSGRNGYPYERTATSGSNKSCSVYINLPTRALVINPSTNIPYENAVLCTQFSRINYGFPDQINEDKIASKGVVDIDLIAINCFCKTGEGAVPYQVCANGNYLCVQKWQETMNETYAFTNSSLYIGWDASNPDIRLESSWAEYSES